MNDRENKAFGTFSAVIFGFLPGGEAVWKISLCAPSGLCAEVLTVGATLHRLYVPTSKEAVDVVLGKASLEEYLKNGLCNSSVIGRCANRIANGKFELNGEEIQLEQNFGKHCIHGGSGCYAAKNFAFSVVQECQAIRLHLTMIDHGQGGFPGQVFFSVDYVLRNNALRIEYRAVPTKDTPWSVTSHAYFDLNGQGSGASLEQLLQIHAEAVLYTATDGIPEAVPHSVAGTAFDFRKARVLREALCSDEMQLRRQGGFDHNYCLAGSGFQQAAILHGCRSHITMEVWTDQPGMQLFTLNQVPQAIMGKDGRTYTTHAGVCLETQQYPNAVNEAAFPNCIIHAGEAAKSVTELRFYEEKMKEEQLDGSN